MHKEISSIQLKVEERRRRKEAPMEKTFFKGPSKGNSGAPVGENYPRKRAQSGFNFLKVSKLN